MHLHSICNILCVYFLRISKQTDIERKIAVFPHFSLTSDTLITLTAHNADNILLSFVEEPILFF